MLENKVESNVLCDSAATGKEYEHLEDSLIVGELIANRDASLIAGELDGSGVPSDELNGSGSAFRVERILSRSSILGWLLGTLSILMMNS